MSDIERGRLSGEELVIKALEAKLLKYKISTASWGKNGFKSVADLARDIDRGTAELKEANGELVLCVELVHVEIYCVVCGKQYFLRQLSEVATDGTISGQNLTGIKELMQKGEMPVTALRRATAAKLGITRHVRIDSHELKIKNGNSRDYPGLKIHQIRHEMTMSINSANYDPAGITVEHNGSTTFFVWEEV